jgi:membrane fusion protein
MTAVPEECARKARGIVPATSLFRTEIRPRQANPWLGSVLLAPRPSHRLFALFAALATAALVAVLVFAQYTRKARIAGWLAPDLGVTRIFAPQPGIVTLLRVHEGMAVRKGATLLVLSTEIDSAAGGATEARIVERLRERSASLHAEAARQRRLLSAQTTDFTRQLAETDAQAAHLAAEIALKRQRLALAAANVAQQSRLRALQLTTEDHLQIALQDRLDQAVGLQTLEGEAASLAQARQSRAAGLAELPLEAAIQAGTIDRDIAALQQQLAEAQSRRAIVVTAPLSGTVTAIETAPGSRAAANVPLLSLIPKGAELQAHLLCPSHAIGFVRPGEPVRLHYSAFPYQKFGSYAGTVATVARSAIGPSELPASLAGLADGDGNRAVYPVTVTLARQTASAYGQSVALRAGMRLDADVELDRRRLIEWVFDPILALARGQQR